MSILKIISTYSTVLLPVCAIFGFFFPAFANAIFPQLKFVLFFLMFFTLLGVDQIQLFKKLYAKSIWGFAFFQNVIICFLVTSLAYVIGLRGDLLLAVAALSATSPLFASGAIVNAMGFDALVALAKTIVATFLMPCTLLGLLWILASESVSLDLVAYTQRIIIYIVCPILLSIIVKKITPKKTLDTYYPKVAEFNILLVLMFPLGLSGGFRATFDSNPHQALTLLITGLVFVVFVFGCTYFAYKRWCKQRAIIAATVSTGRNMVLTMTIASPFIGTMFAPLVGAVLLPMYGLPLVAKLLINRLPDSEQKLV